MIKKYYKNILFFLVLIIFLGVLFSVVNRFGSDGLIEKIGARNSYLIMFVVAFFGGFSAWSSISFLATLITFSIGGLNPIYLGVIAGGALAMGDGLMFYVGSKGRELIVGKWGKKLEKFSFSVEKKIGKAMPFISYAYIGLTPFPNDFLIIFLAMIKYPSKKMYVPIIFGDLTFALLVSVLASKGIMIFTSFFSF